jgi:hypothetical protein
MSIAEELLFSRWRTADRQARLLEQAIATAWLAALDGRADTPSPEQIADVRRMRGVANELFNAAMAEMTSRAASLQPTQHG